MKFLTYLLAFSAIPKSQSLVPTKHNMPTKFGYAPQLEQNFALHSSPQEDSQPSELTKELYNVYKSPEKIVSNILFGKIYQVLAGAWGVETKPRTDLKKTLELVDDDPLTRRVDKLAKKPGYYAKNLEIADYITEKYLAENSTPISKYTKRSPESFIYKPEERPEFARVKEICSLLKKNGKITSKIPDLDSGLTEIIKDVENHSDNDSPYVHALSLIITRRTFEALSQASIKDNNVKVKVIKLVRLLAEKANIFPDIKADIEQKLDFLTTKLVNENTLLVPLLEEDFKELLKDNKNDKDKYEKIEKVLLVIDKLKQYANTDAAPSEQERQELLALKDPLAALLKNWQTNYLKEVPADEVKKLLAAIERKTSTLELNQDESGQPPALDVAKLNEGIIHDL